MLCGRTDDEEGRERIGKGPSKRMGRRRIAPERGERRVRNGVRGKGSSQCKVFFLKKCENWENKIRHLKGCTIGKVVIIFCQLSKKPLLSVCERGHG